MTTFEEVVGGIDRLMGVKAVWGRSDEGIMCFGARGGPGASDTQKFSVARSTAERALRRPFFVTIGGGDNVPSDLNGRVLELVRATGAYGETAAIVRDKDLLRWLEQWPVAVIISETYTIQGEPHLERDLGFANRLILENAFDGVIRHEKPIQELWEKLRNREVVRNRTALPPPGFKDPGKLVRFGTIYPKLTTAVSEGRKVWKEMSVAERSASAAKEAKQLNRDRNGGQIVCEACSFSDRVSALFDAHHICPIAFGERETRTDDFAILCAMCHRWAHYKADDLLSPLTVAEVRQQRAGVVPALKGSGSE